MARVTSLLVWFALLEGLWAMLVGTTSRTPSSSAGFVAAALGAIFADALRSRGLLALHDGLPDARGRVGASSGSCRSTSSS